MHIPTERTWILDYILIPVIFQVTFLSFTPLMIANCVKYEDHGKYDTSSLKRILTATSPLPETLQKKFNTIFNVTFLQGKAIFRSTGPIAVARCRSVGRSVGRSVRPSVNTCNSATNFRIFFKIGGNIPWVNISRPFFRFCKILNFKFKNNKFQF